MEIDDARAGLNTIQAVQAQAVQEAARWRWPRWYVGGTMALMVAVSAALDFSKDVSFFTVVYCCGIALLQIPLAATMRVRLHRSRYTLRTNWPLGVLLVAVAAVYVIARLVLTVVGAPLPSTISGVLMAVAYMAGLPTAHRMSVRRLQAGRG